jgi:ABC-type antimicrobial peptide transport system permease subunit
VAIINESMAKAWGTSEPIGSTLIVGPPSFQPTAPPTELTVVGVVSDFRLFGPSVEMQAQYYMPLVQVGSIGGRVLVRASGDPSALAETIRNAIHSVDPQIPVEQVQTLYELKRSQLQRPALTTGLLSVFAAVALVITLAGISGLIGTAVSQRTREFGVRLALGAGPWRIVGTVVGRGVRLVAIGVAVGVAGAYVFSQTIVKFLFHTTPTDVSAYVAIAAILLGVGALAAFIPARRITGIDPLKALRID